MRPDAWITWVRLLAVPFAWLDVVLELDNYPEGHLKWALALTGAFTLGAILLHRFRGPGLVGLAFDLVIVSAFVFFLAFELGTPVRELLVLPVVEAGLLYGPRGGVLGSLACVPALFLFEWRQSVVLDYYPFDAGHVVLSPGLLLLVGLVVGLLAGRERCVDA